MSRPNSSKKSSTIKALLTSVILVTIALFFSLNRQLITDQITVWQYRPTTTLASLATRSDMSDYGRFLFYASQPKLDSTQSFNTECSRTESTTSILGCYNNNKIYIYNVTDIQLDGIRDVTAAHEMLHAAYARMSESEKQQVDILVEAEYAKLKDDKTFSDLIAYYAKSEPGQRDNELHSMIGTEVADISPALEAHYKKYFSDRQKVVVLYTNYIGIFQSLKSKADTLSAQLNELSASISSRADQYNTDVKVLTSDISSFNTRSDNGDFTSQSQFNIERANLTSRLAALESTKAGIQTDIANYDAILTEYNTLASESQKLYNTINSSLAAAPSV